MSLVTRALRHWAATAPRVGAPAFAPLPSAWTSVRHGSARVVAGGGKGRPRRQLRAAFSITPRAAERLQELLANQPGKLGVRIGVRTRGCNGMSYTMNYADAKAPLEDEVVEHGIHVLIDPKASLHVAGTTMDYVEDELTAEFVFHNPNAKGTCGCGESFNV